ncbi:unnamed protein product [Didymodactylos carnosus]|uniref:Microsomal glutathione S-transferase 1 n=1 Tax=Didymodactylos carnosus TaxID=1234261 RepID=A0A815LBY7_9BILA|nr:unnamed protein product [Didymodactylos carnosus]CAF4296640.1 unnamed protein product [Didymodactylos carnosus]
MANNYAALSVIDVTQGTWCAWTWIALCLIWKNLLVMLLLTIFRFREKRIRAPEDVKMMKDGTAHVSGGPSAVITTSAGTDVFTLTNADRCQRILANEAEYTPYFLVLALAFCVIMAGESTARLVIYGTIFGFGRILHTLAYLPLKNGIARTIGFLLSAGILGAMTIDLCQRATKLAVGASIYNTYY